MDVRKWSAKLLLMKSVSSALYMHLSRRSTCSSTPDKNRSPNVVLETIMLKLQRYNGC